MQEMFVQGSHGFFDVFLGPLRGALVKLHDAKTRENPSASSGKDVSIRKVEPLKYLGLGKRILRTTTELIIGYIISDGVALEQTKAVVAFESWNLHNDEKKCMQLK